MAESVIDMSVVDELVELGDNDPVLLIDLINMFLEDAPQRRIAIVDGARSGDLEAVERAAHSLKGSSGNLGAVRVQDVAESLQVAGRSRDQASVDGLVDSLVSSLDAAEAELRRILASHGG